MKSGLKQKHLHVYFGRFDSTGLKARRHFTATTLDSDR